MQVIIPVKDLRSSKSRLAHTLPVEARQSLMAALLSDLLLTLKHSTLVQGITLVTRCPDVAQLAAQQHCEVLNLDEDRCLNSGIAAAIATLTARGTTQALILHADLPLATSSDIDDIILAHQNNAAAITLIPDNDSNGTNAMVLTLPTTMQFFYGHHSYSAHRDFCRMQGIDEQTVYNTRLGSDIDLWQDFAPLLSMRTAGTRPQLSLWLEQYGELFDWPLTATP
ncbi:MAG: 2-phospho-L-lactate guanylyltransferase [Pseudomonadales bacterium]